MSSRNKPQPISVEAASVVSALTELDFETSASLQTVEGLLGQERVKAALFFGLSMQSSGYNLYVMGESGSGRSTLVGNLLAGMAASKETPDELAYITDFDEPRSPKALCFAPGSSRRFISELTILIANLIPALTAAFEHPEYLQQKTEIDRRFNRRYDNAVEPVENLALAKELALYREDGALGFMPIIEGKSIDDAAFAQLPEEQRKTIQDNMKHLEQALNESLSGLSQWRREAADQHRQHNESVANKAVSPLFGELQETFKNNKEACDYLREVQQHLLQQLIARGFDEQTFELQLARIDKSLLEDNYLPNVVADHHAGTGNPVVVEPHPNYRNLFGRVDYVGDQGVLVTNYRHICGGAVHRANGGYLIVDAEKLLQDPFAWDALKRALKSNSVTIESPYSELGMVGASSLTPQPVALNLKLILIGSRQIHYLLQEHDSDFKELFRVLVDFDDYIPRTGDAIRSFARLLHTRAMEKSYAALHVEAVDALLNFASRAVEHQQRISVRFRQLFDLLAEADFFRCQQNDKLILRAHVEQALSASEDRSARIKQQMLDETLDGTIVIHTGGERVGEVNGLTVWDLGEARFGAAARISASAYPGSNGIVDIEREAELGQAIHSKGVMILTGYLGDKYATNFPLTLSASIALEQSYGYVDGDSASLAELCCLLSAIAQLPLAQRFAVTGSINQNGDVQAIGGVNEKVEGFFRLCQARGLNAGQGVIIPQSNVQNLVLKSKVLQAMEEGKFSIYAVTNVDQAIELLSGKRAGPRGASGKFSKGSFNALVENRLQAFLDMTQSSK